ncbi:hypothetical protein NDU88_000420 [Pleurodeles waltl]|uniref:Uncharacterized protein n=1 Tax=Pleurodeles waltl TaxID=8319 RepID=A0AAV7UPX1_PLEWA|nr:hypothetical protein NDU88_000420 [Pleurodeles waltl]
MPAGVCSSHVWRCSSEKRKLSINKPLVSADQSRSGNKVSLVDKELEKAGWEAPSERTHRERVSPTR